ncbi:hypothetical protein [Rhodococcus sp. NCIMB 12038]|uniref:hypothetical protein n=1 Tax=Rhodococcus sp. NCIMB 12038 TaxID=933800 RepID=UPI000B3C2F72|nr:hypothetical protein [Rhodococcus sp. NCIMB 12038]OUS93634.1 hypothetical protein CA951_22090 [Rhodococcus sp. NCIMB 12038]
MNTRSSPIPATPPAVLRSIPGVVDGSVVASVGADGTLSFHVLFGDIEEPESCDRVEVVMRAEHAAALFTGLPDGRDDRVESVSIAAPCTVGFSFHR